MFETILLVEDEPNARKGLTQFLQGLDYDVMTASDGKEALDLFKKEKPDLVISDIRMPEMDGVALLEAIKNESPVAKVILLTAYGSVEDAVKAMKKGAFYYLTKPVNLEELELLVKKAFSSHQLEEENKELKQELFRERYDQGRLIAQSGKMKELLKTVDKIASSNASVLIEGESGTGKELIARRIHELSARRQHPFIAVHCAALTDTLLSSELFGHEKGAFTGAADRKKGRFERAHEGSLFLDEIGEITQDTQVKLLRVLQEGEFERVGGTKTIKVDVRLIAATNKTLLNEVQQHKFREDLYYRLNVVPIRLPPLRERREDIPLLVAHFLKQTSLESNKKVRYVSDEAMAYLMNYYWPGNIRELQNAVERAVILCKSDTLEADLFPIPGEKGHPAVIHFKPVRATDRPEGDNASLSSAVEALEKSLIQEALHSQGGNQRKAAKVLGVTERILGYKIKNYGLK